MKSLLSFLLFFSFCQVFGGKVLPLPIPPKDPLVVESLIKLHKTAADGEREALKRLNASLAATLQIKEKSISIKDIRETLDSRTTNIYSYVVLAARLAYVSKNLYDFTKQFAHFTVGTTRDLFKKPMCAWYYAEAVTACTREIKNIKAAMVRLGVNQINLMTATMDEKLLFINTIDAAITKCRRIMEQAYMWCSIIANGGYTRLFIYDILNSQITLSIAKSIAQKYYPQ